MTFRLSHELESDLGPLRYGLPRSKNRRLRWTSRVRPMRVLLPIGPMRRTAVPSQTASPAHRSTPSYRFVDLHGLGEASRATRNIANSRHLPKALHYLNAFERF